MLFSSLEFVGLFLPLSRWPALSPGATGSSRSSQDRRESDLAPVAGRRPVRTGLRFLDAPDPASIGCGGELFYDGYHARPECLEQVIAQLRSLEAGGAITLASAVIR